MAARKGDHIYDTCVLYLTTWKKIEKLNFAASAAASNWNFVQQNQHLPQLTLQGDHSLQSVTAHSGLTKPRPPLISGGQTASDPAHIRFSMVLTWGHFLRPILKQQLWHPLRTSRPRGRNYLFTCWKTSATSTQNPCRKWLNMVSTVTILMLSTCRLGESPRVRTSRSPNLKLII